MFTRLCAEACYLYHKRQTRSKCDGEIGTAYFFGQLRFVHYMEARFPQQKISRLQFEAQVQEIFGVLRDSYLFSYLISEGIYKRSKTARRIQPLFHRRSKDVRLPIQNIIQGFIGLPHHRKIIRFVMKLLSPQLRTKLVKT